MARYVCPDCAKVVLPIEARVGSNPSVLCCPTCKSPVMLSKKKGKKVKSMKKTKVKGKKWGKIGAPKSAKRKAFLKSLRAKRGRK